MSLVCRSPSWIPLIRRVSGPETKARLSRVIRPECGWQSPASGGLIGSRASPLPPLDGSRIAASSGTRSSLRGGYLTLSFHRLSSPLQKAKRFIFGECALEACWASIEFIYLFIFTAPHPRGADVSERSVPSAAFVELTKAAIIPHACDLMQQ